MKIGDVAERLGLPASTIRYYEKMGLIEPPRRVSGRREFDERAISSLEFVRLSQAAGFTIAETKSLLESYARNPEVSGDWRKLAEGKQVNIRSQMQSLKQVDAILSELLTCECKSLSRCIEIGLSRNLGDRNADN